VSHSCALQRDLVDDAALQVMEAAAVAEKRLKHSCYKDHFDGQNLKYSLPKQG
jgi:hypothetical protein